MDRKILEFEDQFMDCTRQMDDLYARFAKSNGLTYMSLLVLDCICDRPAGCTQKEICEVTFYSKQSVNLIVKKFLEQGFVRLEEIPEDRRNKRITLTEKGRAWADATIFRFWDAEERAMAALTEEERTLFLQTMRRFVAGLTENVEALLQAGPAAGDA